MKDCKQTKTGEKTKWPLITKKLKTRADQYEYFWAVADIDIKEQENSDI